MLRLNGLSLAIAQALGYSAPVPSFYLNLTNATNATISDGTGTATVTGGGGGTDAAITPSITTNRTAASNTGVAPFAVQFNSKATTAATYTSKPLYELYHAWNFDDASSGVHGYGTKAGSASRNTAYGHTASHVFETPGTYVVDYTCLNPGTLTYNTSSVTITVTDPDSVFSGANTICIANGTLPVAGVNGVPAGATCYNQSSWATVCSYIATGKRVLLKKGDTWSTAATATITADGPWILGAFGTGANPKVTATAASCYILSLNTAHDARITSIDFAGTNLGAAPANDLMYAIVGTSSNFVTVVNSDIGNLFETIWMTDCDDTTVMGCNMHDLLPSSTPWNTGYGSYWARCKRIAYLGNRMVSDGNSHNLRVDGTQDSVFSHCTIEGGGPSRNTFTIRAYETGTEYCGYVVVSDCVITSSVDGNFALCLKHVNNTVNTLMRDFLVERNFIDSLNGNTGSLLSVLSSDLWVRNNIIKETNDYAVTILKENTAGVAAPSSSYIYNNTFWKPNTTTRVFYSAVIVTYPVTGTVVKNNLVYAPGCTLGGTQQGVSITPGLFDYYGAVTGADFTLSNNSSEAQITGIKPWAATTPTTYAEFVANSYGVNGGTTVPIYTDFFDATITGTREIGAIQA